MLNRPHPLPGRTTSKLVATALQCVSSLSFFEDLLPEAAHKDDPALVQRLLGVRAGGGGVLGGRQLGQAVHGILQPLHAGGQVGGRTTPTPLRPKRCYSWRRNHSEHNQTHVEIFTYAYNIATHYTI